MFIKLLHGPVLGVIKSSLRRAAMHISFHSISPHSPPSPHPPPTTTPTLRSLFAEASPCILGGRSEDRGAITYQCSLPCFNTEQMNGLHAISLKDSAAEGAVEVESRVWVCGWGYFVKCPELRRQSSVTHTGVNSYDRGFLSLSSTKTLGLVSISHDGMRIHHGGVERAA